jgi:hypothetical protein
MDISGISESQTTSSVAIASIREERLVDGVLRSASFKNLCPDRVFRVRY